MHQVVQVLAEVVRTRDGEVARFRQQLEEAEVELETVLHGQGAGSAADFFGSPSRSPSNTATATASDLYTASEPSSSTEPTATAEGNAARIAELEEALSELSLLLGERSAHLDMLRTVSGRDREQARFWKAQAEAQMEAQAPTAAGAGAPPSNATATATANSAHLDDLEGAVAHLKEQLEGTHSTHEDHGHLCDAMQELTAQRDALLAEHANDVAVHATDVAQVAAAAAAAAAAEAKGVEVAALRVEVAALRQRAEAAEEDVEAEQRQSAGLARQLMEAKDEAAATAAAAAALNSIPQEGQGQEQEQGPVPVSEATSAGDLFGAGAPAAADSLFCTSPPAAAAAAFGEPGAFDTRLNGPQQTTAAAGAFAGSAACAADLFGGPAVATSEPAATAVAAALATSTAEVASLRTQLAAALRGHATDSEEIHTLRSSVSSAEDRVLSLRRAAQEARDEAAGVRARVGQLETALAVARADADRARVPAPETPPKAPAGAAAAAAAAAAAGVGGGGTAAVSARPSSSKFLASPSSQEVVRLHGELQTEHRKLRNLQEDHNDLLGLIAQQEIELDVFRRYLLERCGRDAVAGAEQESEGAAIERYGYYNDFRRCDADDTTMTVGAAAGTGSHDVSGVSGASGAHDLSQFSAGDYSVDLDDSDNWAR